MRPALLTALAAATALSACGTPQGTAVSRTDRAGAPVVSRVAVPPRTAPRVLREADLRTPVATTPEQTGAPPARPFATAPAVTAATLAATGAETSADMRVWRVRPVDAFEQIAGPPPGTRE